MATIYQQELSMLKVGDDGFYIPQPNDNQVTTKPQPNDNPGQGREENERKWEYREGNDREGIPVPQQIPDTGTGSPGKEPETPDCKEACPDLPPSLEEVKNYCSLGSCLKCSGIPSPGERVARRRRVGRGMACSQLPKKPYAVRIRLSLGRKGNILPHLIRHGFAVPPSPKGKVLAR